MNLFYNTLFLCVCGWSIFRHLNNPAATRFSKTTVLILSAIVVFFYFFAGFRILSAIIVFPMCIYVSLHQILTSPEKAEY